MYGAIEIILPFLEKHDSFHTKHVYASNSWEHSQFAIDLENALFRTKEFGDNVIYSLILAIRLIKNQKAQF